MSRTAPLISIRPHPDPAAVFRMSVALGRPVSPGLLIPQQSQRSSFQITLRLPTFYQKIYEYHNGWQRTANQSDDASLDPESCDDFIVSAYLLAKILYDPVQPLQFAQYIPTPFVPAVRGGHTRWSFRRWIHC